MPKGLFDRLKSSTVLLLRKLILPPRINDRRGGVQRPVQNAWQDMPHATDAARIARLR